MDSVGRNGRVWLWSGAHVVRGIGPVGDVVFAERSRVNHVRISIGFGVLVRGRAILKREVTGECRGTLGGWRYGRDVRVGRVGSEGLGNRDGAWSLGEKFCVSGRRRDTEREHARFLATLATVS